MEMKHNYFQIKTLNLFYQGLHSLREMKQQICLVENQCNAQGGPSLSKYITKTIALDEPADVADVFLNVKQPSGTSVELYYRALTGGSDVDINSVAFIAATPDNTIPTGETFKEVRYQIDPLGENSAFANIQFKIVLKSTSSSKVPQIKDFRAICST